MTEVPVADRTRLLSDNSSGYVSRAFTDYLNLVGIRHILATPFHPCIDRGHSLHMFWDMVDTIIGMTSLQGGGHAMEGDVRYVSEERVRGAGAG